MAIWKSWKISGESKIFATLLLIKSTLRHCFLYHQLSLYCDFGGPLPSSFAIKIRNVCLSTYARQLHRRQTLQDLGRPCPTKLISSQPISVIRGGKHHVDPLAPNIDDSRLLRYHTLSPSIGIKLHSQGHKEVPAFSAELCPYQTTRCPSLIFLSGLKCQERFG